MTDRSSTSNIYNSKRLTIQNSSQSSAIFTDKLLCYYKSISAYKDVYKNLQVYSFFSNLFTYATGLWHDWVIVGHRPEKSSLFQFSAAFAIRLRIGDSDRHRHHHHRCWTTQHNIGPCHGQWRRKKGGELNPRCPSASRLTGINKDLQTRRGLQCVCVCVCPMRRVTNDPGKSIVWTKG